MMAFSRSQMDQGRGGSDQGKNAAFLECCSVKGKNWQKGQYGANQKKEILRRRSKRGGLIGLTLLTSGYRQ